MAVLPSQAARVRLRRTNLEPRGEQAQVHLPVKKDILPITADVNAEGHLTVGGCDAVELAAKFGTPLFVVDEATLRAQCRGYAEAFRAPGVETEVIYASKAFVCQAMCKIAVEESLSIDVSSGGELFVALAAGVPAAKICMHGNNKTPSELEFAIREKVGRLVVDSFNELELLGRLAQERGARPQVLLRITPGIKPSTHSYIQTGQIDSKFGFGLSDGTAMEAIRVALSTKAVELKGIHAHIGSQIFALHSYAKAIELIVDFMEQARDQTGFVVGELNAGGGLGISYEAADEPSTITEYAEVIIGGVARQTEEHGLPMPKVMIEPGRSIVGNAGITLYRVGTIKKIPRVRTYISVDGGMSDNIRPMLYDAVYEAFIANKAAEKRTVTATVAGKHCESGDILVRDARLPQVEVGDVLCTPATGAYGYVMASNYNKQPRPAVVMVSDGRARIIIRRETYEDLIRLEVP